MREIVYYYILNCHTFRRAKVSRDWYHCILKSWSILTRPWTDVTLNSMIILSLNNSYNEVWMMIKQLTKKRHYIIYTTNKTVITTEVTVYLLINNVSKLHGLLLSLTLDRDLQFLPGVWKNLYKIFGIMVNWSTTLPLDSNRQCEIDNRQIKELLRTSVSYKQDDWAKN